MERLRNEWYRAWYRWRFNIDTVSKDEARAILDRQAQELLGISGSEFVRLQEMGIFDETETTVMRLKAIASLT